MANLSNINNKFIVTSEGVGRVLIGDTTVPTSALTVSGQQELVKLTRGGGSDSKWFFSADSAKLYIAEDTSATENIKLTIIDTGNVGIGDTTPSFPLVISKSSSTTSNGADLSMRLGLSNPDQTNNNYALITFGDGTSQPGSGFMGMQFTDHTNNYGELVFGTRGVGGYGEKMRIDSEGKVGIGTTSPGEKLEVKGNIVINSQSTSSATTELDQLIFRKLHPDGAGSGFYNQASIRSKTFGGYSGGLNFYTNKSLGAGSYGERLAMSIDNVQHVGIGTDSPGALLQVGDTPTASSQQGARIYGYDGALSLYTTRSESNFNTALYLYNDPTGGAVGTGTGIMFRANSDTTSGQQQATVYSSWTTNTHASRTAKLVFQTCNAGTVSDKMTILGNGNVGIGTATPQTTLEVNGAASALNAHFGQGANNSSGVFGGISLGYSETGNAGYRKVGIVAKALGDGAARQDLNFLVDTVVDGNSASIADSKMMISGTTGQVNISQKPNSGLAYDLLINLGTSPDGLIGYQTREQFNNATLQKWYNVDAANSGSSQWVRLGTMSNFAQGGYTFCLTFFGHTGYNASNDQDFNCKLFMKTSNGGGTGPRFNSWVENTGKNQASPAFKWVNTNSSGTPTVGGTSFELYMNVPAYANGSIYAINKHSGDWTSQNAIGQSDPGADSTTVLQAQNVFNILNTNVGIGTVSPGAKLHNYSTATSNVFISGYGTAAQNDWGAGHAIFLAQDNGLLLSKANALNNTNRLFSLYHDGGGNSEFYMYDTNSNNKVLINSSGDSFFNGGNVGIGDTSPTSLSANTSSLTVNSTRTDLSGALFQKSNGVVKFQQYWTADGLQSDVAAGNYRWRLANTVKMALVNSTGTLTVVGDIVAYGNPSDKRLKENIKPIESALDKAMKLQGVTFDWKKSDSILKIKEDIGFIAQDVQKVIPELVRENEDGMLSMRHQGIAPILLEAIKEQQEQIKDLRNQINLLKSK